MSILNRIFIYYFIMQIAQKRSRKHNVNYLQDAAYYTMSLNTLKIIIIFLERAKNHSCAACAFSCNPQLPSGRRSFEVNYQNYLNFTAENELLRRQGKSLPTKNAACLFVMEARN